MSLLKLLFVQALAAARFRNGGYRAGSAAKVLDSGYNALPFAAQV
jgi:hypothetical protein